jgi:hypothetical protein
MELHDKAIEYASVDDAIRDLRELIPMLDMAVHSPLPKPPGVDVERAKRALALLRDEKTLRSRLERIALPDGRVRMGFSPAAWALLEDKGAL